MKPPSRGCSKQYSGSLSVMQVALFSIS